MISYLHTNVVPSLPIASNFLVELAKPDRPENDPFRNFKTSPGAWLHKTFKELPDQYHWNGVDPCSPHEMYRLADCYSLDDLRQFSLAFIVRSLTVENVTLRFFFSAAYQIADVSLCSARTSSLAPSRSTTTPFKKPF